MRFHRSITAAAVAAVLGMVLCGCAMIEQMATGGDGQQDSETPSAAAVAVEMKDEVPADADVPSDEAVAVEERVADVVVEVDTEAAESGDVAGSPAEEQPSDSSAETVEKTGVHSNTQLTGITPRSIDDLYFYKWSAVDLSDELRLTNPSDQDQEELIWSAAESFASANAAYRDGNYDEALGLYNDILLAYPLHYGANVNSALALLQLGVNDEALIRALACVCLFPEDDGVLLNAQAAATACGFSDVDINEVLVELLQEFWVYDYDMAGYWEIEYAGDNGRESFRDQYEYNNLWNRIETDLVANLQTPGYDLQGTCAEIDMALADLQERMPDDPAVAQLAAYFEGVMTIAGIQL